MFHDNSMTWFNTPDAPRGTHMTSPSTLRKRISFLPNKLVCVNV